MAAPITTTDIFPALAAAKARGVLVSGSHVPLSSPFGPWPVASC